AERIIVDTLKETYPEHSFMGEEYGLSEGDPNHQWIIDPLDGTTNYLHGFPQFSISIALRYKNSLEQAVIYDPLRDELFTASKGSGAYLNDKRIRVANRKTLDGSLLGTGFPFKAQGEIDHYLKTFKALFLQAADIRRPGSAALDLAYVAAGRLDGFWEMKLSPWDIAAGVLLIQEAGGIVSDFAGNKEFFSSGNVVAGNPKIHPHIVKTMTDNLPEHLLK
ncbi:MAG: inositol monophosphatase, partial [Methylococcales bacterium]|nr:inositol monophosphatase [Methylococcales bacterium]